MLGNDESVMMVVSCKHSGGRTVNVKDVDAVTVVKVLGTVAVS
jgi:hypothetical protein